MEHAPSDTTLQRDLDVLLIEDEPTSAILTMEMLAEHPVALTHVSTLADAVVRLRTTQFDCVMLDLNLPDLRGPATVRRVRNGFPDVPVLVYSGIDGGEVANVAVRGGAQVGLSKDHMDGETLWEGLTQAMARHDADGHVQHTKRLATLLRVAAAAGSVEDRIAAVLQEAWTTIGLETAIVASIVDTTYTVHHVVGKADLAPGTEFRVGDTYCSIVADRHDVVAIDEMGNSAHAGHPCYAAQGLEAYLGAPLFVDGAFYGTVNFSDATPMSRRWSSLTREYAAILADLISGWLTEAVHTRQLDEARSRFELAFQATPIGSLLADIDGRVLKANQTFLSLHGTDPCAGAPESLLSLAHPSDRPTLAAMLARLRSGGTAEQCEVRFIRVDGTEWWGMTHLAVFRDADGKVQHLIVQIEDVTSQREARERLNHLALHDGLTGLPNRVLLDDRITQELSRATRGEGHTAVILMDLDGFKAINDTHGHAAGDELLQAVADRISHAVRPEDTVARLGGDEFVVVCGGLTSPDETYPIINRIRHAVELPSHVQGVEVSVGVSLGVAFASPGVAREPADLLREADGLMYRQKHRRNGTTGTESIMGVEPDTAAIEHDLRDAVAAATAGEPGHGLVVHYQPILNSDTARVDSVEALIRWNHASRGLLPPGQFLPLAEDTGLIIPLGRWTLGQAIADWAATPQIGVNVNASVSELTEPDFVTSVEDLLGHHDLDPQRLCVEVTEQSLLLRHGSAMNNLRALRAMGVRIAIDDFGTGFTALSYLQEAPFTELKVDRSFVADTEADSTSGTILNAIIGLCQNLGLRSVVEGIEGPEALGMVRDMGCDATQGYFHARPAPLSEVRLLVLA